MGRIGPNRSRNALRLKIRKVANQGEYHNVGFGRRTSAAQYMNQDVGTVFIVGNV